MFGEEHSYACLSRNTILGLTSWCIHWYRSGNHSDIRDAATSGDTLTRRKTLLTIFRTKLGALETFLSKVSTAFILADSTLVAAMFSESG